MIYIGAILYGFLGTVLLANIGAPYLVAVAFPALLFLVCSYIYERK